MVTGGGSGGHITPILAVAAEIKRLHSDVKVVYIGQKGDRLIDIPQNDPNIDECFTIPAGKFRRYHGEGWMQLLDYKTQYLNVRDGFRTIGGLFKSWKIIGKVRPDAVFTRGGFVSVPVALAAWLRGVPYMTHDSDSSPSLANRLIARWATLHAVALPKELYPYPQEKTYSVGVPINAEYKPVDISLMTKFRKELGLESYKWVVCVTGGGNGAKALNDIVLENAAYLLSSYPNLALIHIAGRSLAGDVTKAYKGLLSQSDRKRVIVKDFVTDLYKYSGAADIIIARGGATNLAEFSAQGKACIIIPSKQLVWNVKNAHALADANAIIELSEDHAEQERRLAHTVSELIDNSEKRMEITKKFAQFSKPNATADIVKLILKIADKSVDK